MPFIYLTKKILESIPTLIGVSLITFLLLKLAPGDPINAIVGERVTNQRLERIKKSYRMKGAWWEQYGLYLKNVFSGNLGRSYITRRPVLQAYAERFPNTLKLAGISVMLAVVAGLVIGVAGAYIRSSWLRQLFTLFTSFCISTPVFWFGLFLIYVFARVLRILPASGMGDGQLAYIVLPAVTLASRSMAYLARMTKTSLEQVRGARFILAVKARGIAPVAVMLRHTMKNALIPIITLIGLDFGSYLNGSVLTETIFGWNGVGRYLVYSIGQRDYPVIMGGILMGTVIFIAVNIMMDFCYSLVDPRIELK